MQPRSAPLAKPGAVAHHTRLPPTTPPASSTLHLGMPPPPQPIWSDPVFASIFLEPYLPLTNEASAQRALPPLGDVFILVLNLLRSLQEERPGDSAVQAAMKLCAESWSLHGQDFGSVTDDGFLEFVSALVARARALKPGEVVLTPASWASRAGALFVLGRPERAAGRAADYALAVVNTAEGAAYHPVHPNVMDASQPLRATTLLLDGAHARAYTAARPLCQAARHVWLALWPHRHNAPSPPTAGLPAERVCEAPFWVGLFHCLLGGERPNWTLIYERLLGCAPPDAASGMGSRCAP